MYIAAKDDQLIPVSDRVKFYQSVLDQAGGVSDPLNQECGEVEKRPPTVRMDGDTATVRVNGPIDPIFGFDVRKLIGELDDAEPSKINLLVESPGGFMRDGQALYNDLRARMRDGVKVNAEARGVVASAATLPYLAADERFMSEGTQLMVHGPMIGVFLAMLTRKSLAQIDKILAASEDTLSEIMMSRTGNDAEQVNQWLETETWFSPKQAVSNNLATELVDTPEKDDVENTLDNDRAVATMRSILTNWKLGIAHA